MGTPHVPMAIATVEEGSTGPEAVPSGETAVPAVPVPRRQTLQADVATGRKKVASGAIEVVPEAEDATPRKEAPSPLVASRVAAAIDYLCGAGKSPPIPDHQRRSSTVGVAIYTVDPVPSPPDSNVDFGNQHLTRPAMGGS